MSEMPSLAVQFYVTSRPFPGSTLQWEAVEDDFAAPLLPFEQTFHVNNRSALRASTLEDRAAVRLRARMVRTIQGNRELLQTLPSAVAGSERSKRLVGFR